MERGVTRFDDEYGKIVRLADSLVYNHGYNRIGNKDWKDSALQLGMDDKLPVYSVISTEMTRKPHKHAAYVFVTPPSFTEISIDVGRVPRLHQFEARIDRLLSGDGKDLVDLAPLSDLQNRDVDETAALLVEVFEAACKRLKAAGRDDFSMSYDLETIKA